MQLTTEQVTTYQEQGFLLLDGLFSADEVSLLREELPAVFNTDYPGRIFEKGSQLVRGIHGPHLFNDLYKTLAAHPRMIEPAMQVLNSAVYVHQFKVNAKVAFGGDIWEWHQDYQYWHDEDGMPEARAVNLTLFLDDVNEFNGPLMFVPCSQREGMIEVPAGGEATDGGPAWLATVSAKLKYTIDKETLARLVAQHGLVAPKGPKGSVLLFHPNIVHGSTPNMSPFDRILAIISYNSVENRLRDVAAPRPDFMAYREYTPITPVSDDVFRQVSESRGA